MILLYMKFELAFTAVPLSPDIFDHSCWFCTDSLHEPNCSTLVYLVGHLNLFQNKYFTSDKKQVLLHIYIHTCVFL